MAGALQPEAGPSLLLIWKTRDSDTQVTKIITGESVRRQAKSAVGAVPVLRASLGIGKPPKARRAQHDRPADSRARP
jgi:hypothetical protein